MQNKTAFVAIVVLALALGYSIGRGRAETPTGAAIAGPTLLNAAGPVMTSDPGGTTLVLWNVVDGMVSGARAYILTDTRTFDPKSGMKVTDPRIIAAYYPAPGAPQPK